MDTIAPRRPSLPWKALVSALIGLLYGASPLDVIPDVIPLLGWFDDGLVGLVMLVLSVSSFVRWQKARRQSSLVR
ncbi:MAG: DUF1232 domain-containing protein [Chthonomonadaceae bacterium]|nr:DUF1232 domain-containing protein [Chthonomonadaceae bacterium]